MIKNIVTLLCLLFYILLFCPSSFSSQLATEKRYVHEVQFEGSPYELHIFRIYGREKGPTMLIIGGIQGDEPGGFLSADLYTEIALEKGNLIIIPRANFKSIILFNRGVDGDMNRVFTKDKPETEMERVVEIIKKLMKEADVFLNLHDGWGFHRDKYIDELRNPNRFGQSIIIDTDTYKCTNGKEIRLSEIANRVLKGVNRKIKEEKYFMHLFNTRTNANNTPYPEMRKTATYFALKEYCIPSFGIETSKNLPSLEMKILHHNYAINEFMREFGIIPEQPKILLVKPKLHYAVISVNNEPVIVENGGSLFVEENDIIKVIHIESNYERGLSCDVLGTGSLNDLRKEILLKNDTDIIFRKDNIKMGSINVKVRKNGRTKYFVFIITHNNKKKALLEGEVLRVKEGDTIELIEAFGDNGHSMDYIINFKGFIPAGVNKNTGDDRGIKIKIARRRLIKKFSKYGKGRIYPVTAEISSGERARFWLKIED